MSVVEGAVALVTGGASGIGYLVGRGLLEAGAARLVIWDIDEPGLARAVGTLTAAGYAVEGARVDVTSSAELEAALAALSERGVAIDVLVNNAGIIVGREFVAHTAADIERTMAINALAPMQLARAVLPGMVARRRGHVVNIASAAAMVSNPGMSVYCASKWSLVGWSDSLRLELERARSGVGVTTVLPYYIDTGMFAGVRSPLIPLLEPEYVAREIVRAVERGRIFLRLPKWFVLVPLLRGLLPARWFDRLAGDWLGIYHSMSTFRGRAR